FASAQELSKLNEGFAFTFFYLLKAVAKFLFSFEVDVLALKPESEGPRSTLGLAQGSLSGLARTAVIENKKLRARIVSAPESEFKNHSLGEQLFLEWTDREPTDIEVRYLRGSREARRNVETRTESTGAPVFRKDGVYVIAGGAGGIGLRFCEALAGRVKGLVLMGRSELSIDKKKTLTALEKKGSRILYLRADLSKEDEVNRVVSEARKALGGIHGVIHSGGNLEDGLLLSKSKESFAKVFDPKVLGAWNLHTATIGDALDFFSVFSSIVSVIGNVGQADYAAANSFLDQFAHWRNASGASGKTQSLNWTLWADGGMGHKDAVLKQLGMMGITPLPAQDAIPAFERFILSGESQVVVVAGDHKKLSELFYLTSGSSAPSSIPQEQSKATVKAMMKPVSQPQNLQALEAE
ncbi:MAG: SDR family NAD(P)-dependent oxidoreductase, partial [Spirochaetia bacterium]|nr:SDR family NAD(P)-dependent oxidoreductase [Spirochaetia bacterium]